MSVVKKESGFSTDEIEILFHLIQKIRKKNLRVTHGLENLPEKNEIDQMAIILNNKFRALSNPKDPKNLLDNIKSIFNSHYGIENKVPRYPSVRTLEALSSFYYEEFPGDVYEWNDITYKLLVNWKRFKEEHVLENEGEPVQEESVFTVAPRKNSVPVAAREINKNMEEINSREGEVIPPRLLGLNLLQLGATNTGISLLLGAGLFTGLFLVYNLLKALPVFTNNSFSFQTEASFVNLATVLLFIFLHETNYFGFKKIVNKLEGKTIVDASLKQFQGGWLGILISLFVFYAWLTTKYVCYDIFNLADPVNQQITQKFNFITNTFSDFFNLFTAFMYLYLYYILDARAVATTENTGRNRDFSKRMGFAFVTCVAIFTFTVLDRMYDWKMFVMVYSIFTVVAMLMFFSRLNSHFLDEGSSFIPVFYSYAALQAGYSFLLDMYDIRGKVILFSAILFKLLLFSVINNYMQHGRFRQYFESMLMRDSAGKS